MPPSRYVCTRTARLQHSVPLRLHPTARLQSSRAPYLHTSTSTRLQRTSSTPHFHASMTLLMHGSSRVPSPRTSDPAALLQHYIPLRLHAYRACPVLQRSIYSCLHVYTCIALTEFQSSIHPFLH